MTKALKRKEQGKTDYKLRLRLLKSDKPRLIIRKTNKNIIIQFAKFDPRGDKIITGISSRELRKRGWNNALRNIPAAYLTGMLAAKTAKKKEIRECVLDMGIHPSIKGGVLYSALKGVIDGGIKVPCGEIFPTQERIEGKHITENEKTKYTKSQHKEINNQFNKIRKEITD